MNSLGTQSTHFRDATKNRRNGADAESVAEDHLVSLGLRPLARNLRVGRDEIDLVMLTADRWTIVLVEVKSSVTSLRAAAIRLDRRKRARVARAAKGLESLGLLKNRWLRIDAIFIHGVSPALEVVHLPGSPLPPRRRW